MGRRQRDGPMVMACHRSRYRANVRIKEQHQRLGHDIFCTNHHMGTRPSEPSLTSLQLFGSEVIPVFP
jgi:hypothetical protein